MANYRCELRYFQVVLSWAPDPETLFIEKCELIKKSSVRYPEGLKVYFDGNEWLFDCLPTKREVSKILCETSFPWRTMLKLKRVGRGRIK